MTSVHELIPTHGAVAACLVLGLPRGAPGRYLANQRRAAFVGPRAARRMRPRPPMALDALENQALLDEGRYLGSVRTMYRLLARTGGSRERRNQLVHPAYTKPELLAIAPNQQQADALADALLDARLGDDVLALSQERWQQLRHGDDPYWRAIGRDALRLDQP